MNTLLVWILQFFMDRQAWYRRCYLASAHWQRRSRRARRLAGYRCQRCGAERPLDVHHKSYRRLFWEFDRDLIAVCRRCHEKIHS